MRDKSDELQTMRFQPIFVEVLPPFDLIKEGQLWISHKHRTVNLRCPCGCGELAVLSIHPGRWHVCFDGKSVSLTGPTGGSVWTSSNCGSHYFIQKNEVVWSHPIDPNRRAEYEKEGAGTYARLNVEDSGSSSVVPAHVAQPVGTNVAQVEWHLQSGDKKTLSLLASEGISYFSMKMQLELFKSWTGRAELGSPMTDHSHSRRFKSI